MCGIAGIWHLDNAPLYKEKLVRFTDALLHRGPDGGGYHIDSQLSLGLGHRRLSILDLSPTGSQPMPFANERYWIVFNGEVFNFLEIRAELLNKGYTFKSDSDTEVVLAAYHQWGEACLHKFNGMWAFAIWDSEKQTLFLARDRFGVKPLYYLHIPQQIFAFASETIAFKHLDNYQRQWNEDHLALLLRNPFGLEGYGHTTFQQTYQLLGGHYLKINAKQPSIQQVRWWNTLDNLPAVAANYEQQVKQFYELFQDATLLRLRSDVPIASALSGGVDSSAVYCMLHQISQSDTLQKLRIPQDWQKAFVATFPDTSLDEKQYAEEVIAFTQGSAEYIVPDYSNLIEEVKNATLLFDSIYLTPLSIVSNIYKEMALKGFKISLDGHGVDEMLLGYPHFSMEAYKYAMTQNDPTAADSYWDTYLQLFPPSSQATLQKPLQTTPKAPKQVPLSTRLYQQLVPESLKNVYRDVKQKMGVPSHTAQPEPYAATDWLLAHSASQLNTLTNKVIDYSHLNPVDQQLYEAFHLTILPTILRNFDRASMQSSIEIRMPFMDYRLVSYVFGLPLSSKIGNGFTKRILRDAMAQKMPESIRTRKLKIGLNAPMVEWFAGEMATFILDEIHSQAFEQTNLWNAKTLQNFVQAKIKNKSWEWNESSNFWTILNTHILLNNN